MDELFIDEFKKRLNDIHGESDVWRLKREVASKLKLSRMPKNGEILEELQLDERLSSILKMKPTRQLSGVSVVSVMTKPYPCPQGTCIFCPGGVKMNTPQSYTGHEPAAMRAAMNNYDPYLQVQARLKHYLFLGYRPEKIEVIVMGGTFTALPKDYRDNFVTEIYRALNDFPKVSDEKRSLEEEKKINETASHRCVTFTVETKPERCKGGDIKELLDYGVTRVEIGVQSIYNEVLIKNNRGHTIEDAINATKLLKDNAFKVGYHIMLNLPFSDVDKDKETIRSIYEDERFKPDTLKIYPTLVIKGTALYKMWEAGQYKSYPLDDIIGLIEYAESTAPPWLRIMRIERDIPSTFVEGGVKITNLRQKVLEKMDKENKKATDIRSREVGRVKMIRKPDIVENRINYRASGGDEIFLSIDDKSNDAIIGLLRLRIADGAKEGLVRELHVYGLQNPLSEEIEGAFQHHGFGKQLLSRAEEITRNEYSLRKIKVISGVGAREYYRKLNYKFEDPYMVKEL